MKAGGRTFRGLGVGLASIASALAVSAPFVGSHGVPGDPGVAELTEELASGRPFLDAVTLGEWIRDGEAPTILDLQDPGAAVRFTIPTAENVTHGALAALPVDSGATVVLYDGGGDAAVRGWLLLRRLGHPRVRVLQGGVVGWIDGIISPVLPRDTPEEDAYFRRVASVSRYFGGLPRAGKRFPEDSSNTRDAVQLLSRRGCY
jgi:rhodanese-related sulfurtransferase